MNPFNTKVFIACPAYGQTVHTATLTSLMSTQLMLKEHNLLGGFGTLSYPDIVEIRNIFATIWWDRVQSSHMLFVDSDMGWEPQLIADMIAIDKPLVGALAPKKKYPLEFAGRAKLGDVQVVNGFMEVGGVGTGIMLIKREVITAMLAKWPELSDEVTVKNHAAKDILDQQGVKRLIKVFDKIVVNGETISEDLSFCHRWIQCGGDVWANIMHDVSHCGMHEFRGNYHSLVKDHIKPERADVQVQTMPVAPGGDLVPALMAAE